LPRRLGNKVAAHLLLSPRRRRRRKEARPGVFDSGGPTMPSFWDNAIIVTTVRANRHSAMAGMQPAHPQGVDTDEHHCSNGMNVSNDGCIRPAVCVKSQTQTQTNTQRYISDTSAKLRSLILRENTDPTGER
jgi:hypothetical protein